MSGKRLAVWWTWGVGASLALTLIGIEARAGGAGANFAFLYSGFEVSPDGAMLAYPLLAYDQSGDPLSEIWISKADGSEKRRVASLPGPWDVHWLDANHVAATYFDSNRIHLLPLTGGKPTMLSLTDDFQWAQPAIAPDGRYVAFSAVQKKPTREVGVFLLDVSTGEVKRVSTEVVKSFVDWSPDSKRIVYGVGAYEKDYKLTILDVPSGKPTDTGCLGVGARWSPDGQWIAYTGNILRGGSWFSGVPCDGSIVKMKVATKETTVLTEPPVNIYDDNTGRWEAAGAIYPVWSPDGMRIAYRRIHRVMNKDHQGDVREDQIWVMNADGSGRKQVWQNFAPYAWARDGRSLFIKDEKGITQVALDSGARHQIASWTLPEAPKLGEADFTTITAPGARVKSARITPEYAKALLTLAAAARGIYANTLHADVPAVVGVTVTKNSSAQTSLWNDGESEMFLTVTSMDKLAPPQQSGTFNIYGICHELGHMAMYRRIRVIGLPEGIGEGWAYYAGSAVTDEVYKLLGPKLWPVPYDYRKDGLERLGQQVSDPEAVKDPTTRAAAAFYQAHQRYGAEKLFAAMNQATTDKPYGKDLMPRFVEALVKITDDDSARGLFPKDLVTATMQWRTADREITDKTVEGQISVPDATGVTLRYDSGKSDGMRSTAGAGHAVVFKHPSGAWAVDAVEMYGMRYGETEPPKDNFSIFLCDQDFNVVKELQEPYRKLTYGDKPEWNRFEFEPVIVPEGFYVCVFFDPTYTKGFYMHFEKGHQKIHSRSALPWSFVQDVEYDWMIRVHVKQLGG